MAISGILSSQNHYNQRASGSWPTTVTPAYTPLATPFLFYTAPSTQSGSTTWTESRTIPTAVANAGPYGGGSTACELNINSAFVALQLDTTSTTWQPNSNDWYMDLWVYNATSSATANTMVLWYAGQTTSYSILFYDPNAGTNYIIYPNIRSADTGVYSMANDTTLLRPSLNTWAHYAMQYDKTTKKVSLFKDGAYVTNTTLGANGWSPSYFDRVSPLNWYAGYTMGGVWRFSNFRIGYGRRFKDGQSYSTTYSNLYGNVPAY